MRGVEFCSFTEAYGIKQESTYRVEDPCGCGERETSPFRDFKNGGLGSV